MSEHYIVLAGMVLGWAVFCGCFMIFAAIIRLAKALEKLSKENEGKP